MPVVLCVDLSPMQPAFAAPNVTFEVDDLEEDWLYKQKFDFIQSRMVKSLFFGDSPTRLNMSCRSNGSSVESFVYLI